VNRRPRARLLERGFLFRGQKAQEEDASVFELVALEGSQVSIVEEREVLLGGGVGETVDAV
jgi:hypothetical protein